MNRIAMAYALKRAEIGEDGVIKDSPKFIKDYDRANYTVNIIMIICVTGLLVSNIICLFKLI